MTSNCSDKSVDYNLNWNLLVELKFICKISNCVLGTTQAEREAALCAGGA